MRTLKTAEMKFMRRTARYTLVVHRRNERTKWSPTRKEISTL